MAGTPMKPMVDRGLAPNLKQLQRVGDGQSDTGAGTAAARSMTSGMTPGGGSMDGQTQGGLKEERAGKYAHLPLYGPLLGKQIRAGSGTVQ